MGTWSDESLPVQHSRGEEPVADSLRAPGLLGAWELLVQRHVWHTTALWAGLSSADQPYLCEKSLEGQGGASGRLGATLQGGTGLRNLAPDQMWVERKMDRLIGVRQTSHFWRCLTWWLQSEGQASLMKNGGF